MHQGTDIFLIAWLTGVMLIWPPWFWYVINSRRKRGEPLVPRRPPGAAFYEPRASGGVRGNLFAQASRCLSVAVTGDELWIALAFPFNLVAPHGAFGLEQRVARRRIRVVETKDSILGSTVVIEVPQSDGNVRTLDLRIKKPEAFLAALTA